MTTWNYRIVRSLNTPGDAATSGAEHYHSLREIYYNEDGKPSMMTVKAISFVSDADDAVEEIIRSLEMAIRDAKRYPVIDEEEFDRSEAVRRERQKDTDPEEPSLSESIISAAEGAHKAGVMGDETKASIVDRLSVPGLSDTDLNDG